MPPQSPGWGQGMQIAQERGSGNVLKWEQATEGMFDRRKNYLQGLPRIGPLHLQIRKQWFRES